MRGTGCVEVSVETFATADFLPRAAQCLLDAGDPLFASRPWWAAVLAEAMPVGSSAIFLLCRAGDRVLALVPLRRNADGGLEGLTTPYSCCYEPLFAADLDPVERVAAMAAFGRFCRGGGVTRLDALPAEWFGLPDLLAGVRHAGLRPLRFDHFGNWHEDVAGLEWAAYLARRPGALRETIRRRLRQADRLAEARFALLTEPAQMDAAAEAFESVYARSWKEPEPHPHFNVALMRAMADRGMLRFGVWSIGAVPVAVQLWAVAGGCATVLKLAHDEAFRAQSPGTVLTALMLRHLLDQDRVGRIDFGRGDDAYKRGWAARRRQRIGLLMVNPWRPSGALALARHFAGRLRLAAKRGLNPPAGRGLPPASDARD